MKKPLLFIGFNFIVITILSLIQVVVSNNISTTGIELGKLQDEISLLKKQNIVLREQVLISSSLTNIASRASEMGFKDSSSPLVISRNTPLARR